MGSSEYPVACVPAGYHAGYHLVEFSLLLREEGEGRGGGGGGVAHLGELAASSACARATGGKKPCAGGSGAAEGLRGPRLLLQGSSPTSRPRKELLPQFAFPPGGREATP